MSGAIVVSFYDRVSPKYPVNKTLYLTGNLLTILYCSPIILPIFPHGLFERRMIGEVSG